MTPPTAPAPLPQPVGVAHAVALAAIHAAAFAGDEAWSPRAMAELLASPGVCGWIDRRGGMVLARVVADEAEILTLAVVPVARRGGVGRGLLQAALAEAARLGARSMFLEVSAGNLAARALYRAAGFAPVGERAQYYPDGSAALLLKISLCG